LQQKEKTKATALQAYKVLAFEDNRVSGVLGEDIFKLGLVTIDDPHFGQPNKMRCSEI
jgi:hypothetical protein